MAFDRERAVIDTPRFIRTGMLGLLLCAAVCGWRSAAGADTAFDEPALYETIIDPVKADVGPFPHARSRDVLTQRNNNQRTGTAFWPGFDQSSVAGGQFGLLGAIPVKGAVMAQPLFMESVQFTLPGGLRVAHSVLYVATSKNEVCAFDPNPPFTNLWGACRTLGAPFIRPAAYPYANCDPGTDPNCEVDCPGQLMWAEGDTTGHIGIEATPAIDPVNHRLLVSYRHYDAQLAVADPTYVGTQHLAALDLATGNTIADHVVESDPVWNKLHRNRASLLVAGRLVFVAFAGMCEVPQGEYKKSYQGWIYAFDAETLRFVDRYRSMQKTTDGSPPSAPSDPVAGGGIWQGSTGLAADNDGNVFFSTGNATKPEGVIAPHPSWKNLSNSVVRLKVTGETPTALPPSTRMAVVDWFTPYRKTWQEQVDMDLGSAGVVLIPGTRYLVTGGKEGILYVLDGNHFGRFDNDSVFNADDVHRKHKTAAMTPDNAKRDHVAQKFVAAKNQYCAAATDSATARMYCFDNNYVPTHDEITRIGPGMDGWIAWPHIHGTPVFGEFGDGKAFLYIWPEKDSLKSYEWLGNRFKTEARSASPAVLAPPYLAESFLPPNTFGAVGMPGGMLSLTIDPSHSSRGVLFASVQRCRSSDQEAGWRECSVSLCSTPDNCKDQRFGMLRAFDPIRLTELWNDQQDGHSSASDKNYLFVKYVPPTIANGRVYLATASNKVLVYGSRPR